MSGSVWGRTADERQQACCAPGLVPKCSALILRVRASTCVHLCVLLQVCAILSV